MSIILGHLLCTIVFPVIDYLNRFLKYDLALVRISNNGKTLCQVKKKNSNQGVIT